MSRFLELPMPSSSNELPSEYEILLAVAFASHNILCADEAFERYGSAAFERSAESWVEVVLSLVENNGSDLNQQHIRWWAWHHQGILAILATPVPAKKK